MSGKNGSGNGSGNGGQDDHSDDLTPPNGLILGDHANRELMTFLGNDIIELRHHSANVESLYEAVRSLTFPAGPKMQVKILEEYERHHEANGKNVENLRRVVHRAGGRTRG